MSLSLPSSRHRCNTCVTRQYTEAIRACNYAAKVRGTTVPGSLRAVCPCCGSSQPSASSHSCKPSQMTARYFLTRFLVSSPWLSTGASTSASKTSFQRRPQTRLQKAFCRQPSPWCRCSRTKKQYRTTPSSRTRKNKESPSFSAMRFVQMHAPVAPRHH